LKIAHFSKIVYFLKIALFSNIAYFLKIVHFLTLFLSWQLLNMQNNDDSTGINFFSSRDSTKVKHFEHSWLTLRVFSSHGYTILLAWVLLACTKIYNKK
jgi:hypothetical protein